MKEKNILLEVSRIHEIMGINKKNSLKRLLIESVTRSIDELIELISRGTIKSIDELSAAEKKLVKAFMDVNIDLNRTAGNVIEGIFDPAARKFLAKQLSTNLDEFTTLLTKASSKVVMNTATNIPNTVNLSIDGVVARLPDGDGITPGVTLKDTLKGLKEEGPEFISSDAKLLAYQQYFDEVAEEFTTSNPQISKFFGELADDLDLNYQTRFGNQTAKLTEFADDIKLNGLTDEVTNEVIATSDELSGTADELVGVADEVAGVTDEVITDDVIDDIIENSDEEASEIFEELSTDELIAGKISNSTKVELKILGNEWFEKLKAKDFNKLTKEEMSWFIQLSEKGAITAEQAEKIMERSPTFIELSKLLKDWEEYDTKYKNFRENQKYPTFDKFLESKKLKPPTGVKKLGANTWNFFGGLATHYKKILKFDMGPEWWRSFLAISLHCGIIFSGLMAFTWRKSKEAAAELTNYLDDLIPLSNEEIIKSVDDFFKYDDPKIDGISIYGDKDAVANANLKKSPPTVTILSKQEGTIQLEPGISVNGKIYTTFKFKPSKTALVGGSESFSPHTMSTITSTPSTQQTDDTIDNLTKAYSEIPKWQQAGYDIKFDKATQIWTLSKGTFTKKIQKNTDGTYKIIQ